MVVMVDTAMARGRPMPSLRLMLRPSPRLMPPQLPTMVLAAMVVMEAMAAMVDTDTARGPLMPMPTTAMAVMEDMATAKGPLKPMPTTDMAAMVDMDTAKGP